MTVRERFPVYCLPLFAASRLLAAPPAAGDTRPQQVPTPAASQPQKPGSLPGEVMGFQGKVTGSVVSVDPAGASMKIKVSAAEPHATGNKASKPGAITGMTITVTALQVKPKEGPAVPDPKAVAYMSGAKAGDTLTVEVRTSSKGEVFRLLKVPTAGKR